MSERFFSLRLFSLLWGIGYAAAVYINYPLFRYYPAAQRFSLSDLADKSLGPAMSWYGWIVGAAIPALLITAIAPKRIGDRIPPVALWVVIVAMMIAGWHREQDWFLK
jgi:hypothetical protein